MKSKASKNNLKRFKSSVITSSSVTIGVVLLFALTALVYAVIPMLFKQELQNINDRIYANELLEAEAIRSIHEHERRLIDLEHACGIAPDSTSD